VLADGKTAFKTDMSSMVACGCFDDEDNVFFTPDGNRTDCAGTTFAICLPDEELLPRIGVQSEFTILAFGWSENLDAAQYTVIDTLEWSRKISSLRELLTQGANTQSQLLRMMALWDIPKVSSIVLPFRGSDYSIQVRLKPKLAERTIEVKWEILDTEDVIHEEESGRWEW